MQKLIENVGASLYRLRKKEIISITEKLDQQQWWPPKKLHDLCDQRSKRLVRYAYENVPYYSKVSEFKNIKKENIDNNKYLQEIPILKKEILRTRYDDLKGDYRYVSSAIRNASGGSTGKPVSFLTDINQYRLTEAILNHVFKWSGWKYGESILCIWGANRQKIPLLKKEIIKFFIKRQIILSAQIYSETIFKQWIEIITKFKPTIIYGYPSIISIFAKWINDNNFKVYGVKGVYCSAETLLFQQRQTIEKVFGCKVFNQYGSRETPGVACECEKGNIHIFNNLNRVEFVKTGNKLEEFPNIIVTPLFNFAQPLLRYDTGDFGNSKNGNCECGRGYPLMENILGRQNDHLTSKGGKKIYASYFHHLLDGQNWVKAFQFRQKSLDELELIIEVEENNNNELSILVLRENLLKRIIQVFGNNLKFEIKVVKNIEKTIAGKHRFVINEIEQ